MGLPPPPSSPASSLLSLLSFLLEPRVLMSIGLHFPTYGFPTYEKELEVTFFHYENQFCHRSCPSTFSNSQSVGCSDLKGHRLSWTTLTPPTEEPFKGLTAKSSSDTAQAQACLFPVLGASSYFLPQVLTDRELSSLSV